MKTYCTCNHGDHVITLCPLHAAAPALAGALKEAVLMFEQSYRGATHYVPSPDEQAWYENAQHVLRLVGKAVQP